MKQFMMILSLLCCLHTAIIANYPVSRDATLVEVTSPSEVVVESVGIYRSDAFFKKRDVKKHGTQKALLDAKRAGLYYLLFSGSDPILNSEEDQRRFDPHVSYFFSTSFVNALVSQTHDHITTIALNKGRGVKVRVSLKYHRDTLIQALESYGIIFSTQSLTQQLGYPQIMVLPQTQSSQSPLTVLNNNARAKHCAGVIESYLSNKKFDVIIPSQGQLVDSMSRSIADISSETADSLYDIALSIGSDIYIDFAVSITDAAYTTEQVAVTLRAFETTTGRLLGSDTGYATPRKGQSQLGIEEATNQALTTVLSRIKTYWEDDLSKGIQYKLVISIESSTLSSDDIFTTQDQIFSVLEDLSQWTKELIVTPQTMDIILWCDADLYPKSRLLIQDLKTQLDKVIKPLSVQVTQQNRKYIFLTLENT